MAARKTHIIRVYGEGDESERYWVDLEVIDRAEFSGAQFPGLDYGNYPLETTLTLDATLAQERATDLLEIQMLPDGEGAEDYVVNVPVISSIVFSSKGRETVERVFDNRTPDEGGKPTRRSARVRIISNSIADEFLEEDSERGAGKQPPRDPDEYLDAVDESDDQARIWLDVCVTTMASMFRGTTAQYQDIDFSNIWGEATIDMPGAQGSPQDAQTIFTDPYHTIINFGPDSLAVEFDAAAETGDESGGGAQPDSGGGPPQVGETPDGTHEPPPFTPFG